jgi:hypothetical protein
MRVTKLFYIVNILAIIVLAGCGGVSNSVPRSGISVPLQGNYVVLQSDKGDFVGQGQTHIYTPSDAHINLMATRGNCVYCTPAEVHINVKAMTHLYITIVGDEGWSGNFQVPDNLTRLEPGYYDGLKRYPFHNPVKGGLDWSGEGRGCNKLTGWFAIDSVTYDNNGLTAIDIRFEQHCEDASPALHGRIHWSAL